MLNEDFADRTMPPTERHRREARSRGEVARSSELTSAVVLLAASCLLYFLTPSSTSGLIGLMRNALTAPPPTSLTIGVTTEMVNTAGRVATTFAWPILFVIVLSGIMGNLTQTGWLWTPASIAPRFAVGRLFSWDAAAKGMGIVIRLGLLSIVTWRFLVAHQFQIVSIGSGEPIAMLVQSAQLVGELIVQLSISLVLLALADYGFQYWRHEQRLKMTVEERRREALDDAIDPRIKQQRKAMQDSRAITLAEVGPLEAANG